MVVKTKPLIVDPMHIILDSPQAIASGEKIRSNRFQCHFALARDEELNYVNPGAEKIRPKKNEPSIQELIK
jgi:hypothetical protein